jgi:hypothetical protein
MMDIRDHGAWTRYTPAQRPKDAPANTLFARRASDGVDWYDYVNAGEHFAKDSIKLTVVDGVVGAATTDPTALFPGRATVLEIRGVSEPDPQAAFGRKVYDAASKAFRDPPPQDFPNPIADLLKRIEALEGKGS